VPSASVLAHEGLVFAHPLDPAAVDRMIAALELLPGARVLETGCGSAELLVRTLERHPYATGVGVDLDGDWLARAEASAQERVPGRAEFVHAAAAAANLAPGSFDVVINVASSHAHGGCRAALPALAGLARPGGTVVFGEGFWARTPSAAFLAALGGAAEDELPTHDGLVGAARAAGLELAAEAVASDADWDRYEDTLAANAERRGDTDSAAYARSIRERRALPGARGTLGFALLVLRGA
jgi:SAM-dependent methyltransferase